MKLKLRKGGFTFALGSAALLSACSGHPDDAMSYEDGSEAYAEGQYAEGEYAGEDYAGEGYADEEGGLELGTSKAAFSYPTCMYSWSDPDGDGWGWEFWRSCKMPTTSTSTTSGGSTTTSTSSSCTNHDGAYSTMAAIAVSAAMELKRWQPSKDFMIGRVGWDEMLLLTSTGKSRCSDGQCANTQALLDFQKNEANGQVFFPGNVSLSAGALRSRLVAKFREQVTCEQRPSNGGTSNCPVEEHTLTFQRSEKGGCDTNFFFVAKKTNGSPLQYPAQLKNKLLWADTNNPYVGFQSVGEIVSIDPTYGLNEAGSTSTGSCAAACTKISRSYIAGQCCSCNGATRKYARSPWSSITYLCK